MTNERAITAGFFVLPSLGLGYWVHPGFTNACPAMWIFRELGLPDAPGAGRQVLHG